MRHLFTALFVSQLLTSCNHSASVAETPEPYVAVAISAGKLQCDESSGLSIVQTEGYLADAGIEVIESFCAERTGVSVITQCGAATLEIHIHRVAESDLLAAENAGFFHVDELTGYRVSDDCGL